MLDVHPPHAPTHTWRDFFIHIATIIVGLLIAIGLEQTVEAIHHDHQREELRSAIDRDIQQSIHDGATVQRIIDAERLWLKQRTGEVRMALDTSKFASNQRPAPGLYGDIPLDGAWRSAKASGLSELMPQQDVRAYEEVNTIIDQLIPLTAKAIEAQTRRANFEEQFRYADKSRWPDSPGASPDDLRRYLDLLNEEASAADTLTSYLTLARGADAAIANGERNMAEIEKSEKAK
jgi:hypothetical protein